MISLEQIKLLSKKFKIHDSVIFREYLQLVFLSHLYSENFSEDVFFKGGTAIHLIFQAPRFSEDLDFTVIMAVDDFEKHIQKLFSKISKEINVSFKRRETITGKRYLLTAKYPFANFKTFINLDFSFRENIWEPQNAIIQTDYPILFSSHIKHLSKDELLAEKIRAILCRERGRDVYDLWFLLSKGAKINKDLLKKKLVYYSEKKLKASDLPKRVENFDDAKIASDLKPFIPLNERPKLNSLIKYIKDFISDKFSLS